MKQNRIGLILVITFSAGCNEPPAAVAPISFGNASDTQRVDEADYSILFIGNSHTSSQDLPSLICKMIQFRFPEKKTYAHVMGVGHLEAVATDPRFDEEIQTRSWKFVVLQAQKISVSGKFDYSRTEGIEFAKRAKDRGANVLFFAEWGLKDKAGDGERQETIYAEMARDSGTRVAHVANAWDIALAQSPDLPLHARDGNHQSATGAFLTALVLFSEITGESPSVLSGFPYESLKDDVRKILIDAAEEAHVDEKP